MANAQFYIAWQNRNFLHNPEIIVINLSDKLLWAFCNLIYSNLKQKKDVEKILYTQKVWMLLTKNTRLKKKRGQIM